jgi:hypothetical protein
MWFAEGVARDEVLERRDAAKAALDATLEAADADLAACLREELRPVVHAYQAAKQRAGVLDFVDLLIRARDLIVADATVRTGYQARFTHFFVDEFQDTDPLQAEILLLLAADDPEERDWRNATPVPGKIFLVGDPKQSIYRFRRADVAIYEATKRHLEAQGAALLYLTTSFRSVPSLQDAVNAAFAPCMRGAADGSQADYVALQPSREEVFERPSIVALPVPRPYGDYGRVVAWRIEDSLPDATGAFVDWLVNESGWTLVDRDGNSEPIRPRHVCLLFRRFKSFREDVTRPYVRALEARRVPHVLVGGRSFHDREEVLAIRNALGAIEWPDSAPSSGPTTTCASSPRCAGRSSRSPTRTCCRSATCAAACTHCGGPRASPRPNRSAVWRRHSPCCARCISRATGDPSPTRSRGSSRRSVPTRESRYGPRESRPSPIACAPSISRGASSDAAQPRSAPSSSAWRPRPCVATRQTRRSWRKEPRASAS